MFFKPPKGMSRSRSSSRQEMQPLLCRFAQGASIITTAPSIKRVSLWDKRLPELEEAQRHKLLFSNLSVVAARQNLRTHRSTILRTLFFKALNPKGIFALRKLSVKRASWLAATTQPANCIGSCYKCLRGEGEWHSCCTYGRRPGGKR